MAVGIEMPLDIAVRENQLSRYVGKLLTCSLRALNEKN